MTTSLAAGQIFANRYEVVRCIGSGGMGAVYEVIHLETERRRALKVMHAHFADSADFRERFKREARVAAQIDSDYIVDVFDAGVDDAPKMPFLAMELLRGEELARTLKRLGRMPPGDGMPGRPGMPGRAPMPGCCGRTGWLGSGRGPPSVCGV